MPNWRDFPLPDGSYSDACRPWSHQDVVNYLPTPAEAGGTRSTTKYRTAPGLRHFAHVGNGPHRGARDVEGRLFVVSGRTLYQVGTNGVAESVGTIPGTGRVSMTHNQVDGGNQLIIATGDNSFVYDTTTSTLTATGVPLVCVDFLNQLIIGVDVGRRFWRYSQLADAGDWDELDNESAESSPDRIVGGIVSQGEWMVFGERTIEVFANAPDNFTSFRRTQVIEKGCANANTICRLDNSVFWVGNDDIPYRLNGYTPVPIASKAIISTISKGNPKRLFAFTWEDRGHVVYYLTAQDGYTFGYDVPAARWHRRESFGLKRWRVNTLTKWNGEWYAGDFQNGRLYRVEWDYVYEGCEIMPRKFRTGVLHNDGNRVSVHGFRLTVATGGAPSVPNCPEPTPDPELVNVTWLAIGNQTYVGTGLDGATWATAGAASVSTATYIETINERIVYVGPNTAGYSDDLGGVVTAVTPPWGASGPNRPVKTITGRIYVTANDTNLYHTDDGATWTTTALGFTGGVIAGDDSGLLIHTSGTNLRFGTIGSWVSRTAPITVVAIGYGDGMFMVGGSFTNYYWSEDDGAAWTMVNVPAPGGDTIENYSMFRTVSGAWLGMNREPGATTTTLIARSTDGKQPFAYVTTPSANSDGGTPDNFVQGGDTIVAHCRNSSGYLQLLRSTDDGVTWSTVTNSIPVVPTAAAKSIAAILHIGTP